MKDIESTIRHGSLRIDIRRYARGVFGFDFTPPGETRKQVRYADLGKAEDKARELIGAARAGRVERLAIDEDEYADFLRWKAARRAAAPVDKVATAFLALKAAQAARGDITDKHHGELKHMLEKFAAEFSGPVHEIQRAAVEAWLAGLELSGKRHNHYRAAIVGLVRYARAEHLIGADPLPIEQLQRRAVNTRVETYTPAELRALLDAVCGPRRWQREPEGWLPYVVFGAFAGLRPEEVAPMDPRKPGLRWENVLWAKGKVDVPASVSKTRKRRFVPLLDAAQAWLEPWRNAKGPVVPNEGRACDQTPTWSKRAGVPWRYDALRHSYASYRLAVTQDMAALALEMGNSPAMIFRHYLDLKHDDEAAEWFAIRPGGKSPNSPNSPSTKGRKLSI